MRLPALVFGTALGTMIAGMAGPAFSFDATEFHLDNGMQVVVLPNHRAPIVHHMVWYRVGAADEAPGQSGIAHLLEHLMFKGTKAHPGDAYSQFIVRHGGKENAFTSNDQTAYHQTIAKEHLPEIMAMEADRMSGLNFTAEEFTAERSVVIEEREQRVGNNPGARMGEAMMAAMYQNHPYGTPVIGWRHEIEALDQAAVMDFYHRWYAPQNAILIVAGDVTPDEVRDLAQNTYGKLVSSGAQVARKRPKEPQQYGQRRVVVEDKTVGTNQFMIRYLAPTEVFVDQTHFAPDTSAAALTVLAYVLGGDSTMRLNRKLVEEQSLAVAAGAYYDPSGLDYSGFTAYIVPGQDTDLETAEKALMAELDLVLNEGISQAEIDTAIRRIKVDLIYEQDSLTTGARIIGRTLANGGTLEMVQSLPEQLDALTREQVMQAAGDVLNIKRSVAAILRPTPDA